MLRRVRFISVRLAYLKTMNHAAHSGTAKIMHATKGQNKSGSFLIHFIKAIIPQPYSFRLKKSNESREVPLQCEQLN